MLAFIKISPENFLNNIRFIKSNNHNFIEMPNKLQNYLNICIKLDFENYLKYELISN